MHTHNNKSASPGPTGKPASFRSSSIPIRSGLGHGSGAGLGGASPHFAAGEPQRSVLPWCYTPYNRAVDEALFEEIKQYVGFTEADAAALESLAATVVPRMPQIADRFYEELFRHPSARAVFTGGDEQIARQRVVLAAYIRELFEGNYDLAYYGKRLRIGATHVRVGLPQRYMCLGIEILRQEISRAILEAGIPDAERMVASVHRLLTIDLAVMLESYKESYSDHIRNLERNAVEERLTRAEHLAQIGQLAATLAHEIKNPLAGISGAIQIIRDDLGPNDPHHPIIGEILAQIHRLDATVKDLLFYARPAPPRATDFHLGETVRRVLMILSEEPSLHELEVRTDPGAPEARIHADDGQIEQVLINLLINAAHASPPGGTINVAVSHDDDRVVLVVRDRGRGMTPEVKRRAFEPFFTTKAKGTGLGLSICRRIVEAHGGKITLESAVGRGTTVFVEFPHRTAAMAPGAK